MNNEELRIGSNTMLGIDLKDAEQRILQDETQYLCEGEEDKLKLMKLLQDKTITGRDRQQVKFLNFQYVYGDSNKNLDESAKGGGKNLFLDTPKQRSEARLMTFQVMYGTRHKYIPTKIKKGCGKGKFRLQRIIK